MSLPERRGPGPIALVGSGEYLKQMQEIDQLLLAQVGGPAAHVVVLPTAAGLEEPASPRRWAAAGIRHFTRLGAETQAAHILVREDAFDPRWSAMLEQADLIYFSGGNPRHLIDTLAGSPAWNIIRGRQRAGAVLAGCSAGAMAFGRVTLQPRRLWGSAIVDGVPPADTWYPALGLVPNVVVLPHFDRWLARMTSATLIALAASLPADVSLIGIDEDTALVSLDPASLAEWRVMGRQSVSIITAENGLSVYRAGEAIIPATR